jgi:hypothetical protein
MLGLIIGPTIGHPTPKPITNQWLLSSILMTPVVLFEHAIGSKDAPPEISMRTTGISYSKIRNGLSNIRQISSIFVMTDDDRLLLEGSFGSDKEKNDAVGRFWDRVLMENGVFFSSSAHGGFLKAIVYNDQKVFLVGDPKRNDYQLQTFEQFREFIKKETPKFSAS